MFFSERISQILMEVGVVSLKVQQRASGSNNRFLDLGYKNRVIACILR